MNTRKYGQKQDRGDSNQTSLAQNLLQHATDLYTKKVITSDMTGTLGAANENTLFLDHLFFQEILVGFYLKFALIYLPIGVNYISKNYLNVLIHLFTL